MIEKAKQKKEIKKAKKCEEEAGQAEEIELPIEIPNDIHDVWTGLGVPEALLAPLVDFHTPSKIQRECLPLERDF